MNQVARSFVPAGAAETVVFVKQCPGRICTDSRQTVKHRFIIDDHLYQVSRWGELERLSIFRVRNFTRYEICKSRDGTILHHVARCQVDKFVIVPISLLVHDVVAVSKDSSSPEQDGTKLCNHVLLRLKKHAVLRNACEHSEFPGTGLKRPPRHLDSTAQSLF